MARSPCDRGAALSWDHVTFSASLISSVTNQIALPFGDHLKEHFCVSQNFFQRDDMCLGPDLGRCAATTYFVVAGHGLTL